MIKIKDGQDLSHDCVTILIKHIEKAQTIDYELQNMCKYMINAMNFMDDTIKTVFTNIEDRKQKRMDIAQIITKVNLENSLDDDLLKELLIEKSNISRKYILKRKNEETHYKSEIRVEKEILKLMSNKYEKHKIRLTKQYDENIIIITDINFTSMHETFNKKKQELHLKYTKDVKDIVEQRKIRDDKKIKDFEQINIDEATELSSFETKYKKKLYTCQQNKEMRNIILQNILADIYSCKVDDGKTVMKLINSVQKELYKKYKAFNSLF